MTGGPRTRSMKVVHGPGPKWGSMDPWSMFCPHPVSPTASSPEPCRLDYQPSELWSVRKFGNTYFANRLGATNIHFWATKRSTRFHRTRERIFHVIWHHHNDKSRPNVGCFLRLETDYSLVVGKNVLTQEKITDSHFWIFFGYSKNTHKNPKFGKVRQVPTREFPTKFPDWDSSHSSKFGIFVGIL